MSQIDKELHDLFHRQAGREGKSPEKRKECLSELVIHRFLEKKSGAAEREKVEKHLLECYDCLQWMAEISKAKTAFERGALKSSSGQQWAEKIKKELPPQRVLSVKHRTWGWLMAAIVSFGCSFFFRRYFVQFSAAALFFGIKWIVETRTTKVLIAVQDAWRRGDRQTAEELLEKLGKRK
ncbi:MAG: hypothetical protein HYS56_04055 [Candidatus Omnitrophica bacterium]|nr:hypothetical protein [Candidatus Omnitrophota bacterium]